MFDGEAKRSVCVSVECRTSAIAQLQSHGQLQVRALTAAGFDAVDLAYAHPHEASTG